MSRSTRHSCCPTHARCVRASPLGLLALPVSALLPSPLHNRPNRRAFPLLGSCLRADVPLLEHAAVAAHVLALQSSRWDSGGSCGAETLEMSLKRRVVLVFQCVMKQIRLVPSRGRAVYIVLAIQPACPGGSGCDRDCRCSPCDAASLRRFKAHDAALRHALVGPSVAGRLLRECDFWNRVEGGTLRARTR